MLLNNYVRICPIGKRFHPLPPNYPKRRCCIFFRQLYGLAWWKPFSSDGRCLCSCLWLICLQYFYMSGNVNQHCWSSKYLVQYTIWYHMLDVMSSPTEVTFNQSGISWVLLIFSLIVFRLSHGMNSQKIDISFLNFANFLLCLNDKIK